MNEHFKQIRADKIIRISMGFAIIFVSLHLLYLAIFYFSLPPVIPLFNQMPWGDARLGIKLEVFIPLAITFVFVIFNYFFLARLYATMPLVSRIISITTMLATLLSFIFIVRTLQLIL